MSDHWMEFTDLFTGESCFPYYKNVREIIEKDGCYILRMGNGKCHKFNTDSYTAHHHSNFIQEKLNQKGFYNI